MKKDKSRSVFPKKKATSGATPRKGPGRPRLAGESTYMRLDSATLRRVAKRKEQLQAAAVADLSQSDVLRSLIGDGLDLAEGKHATVKAATEAVSTLNQLIVFMEELSAESLDRLVLVDCAKDCIARLIAAGARNSVARSR